MRPGATAQTLRRWRARHSGCFHPIRRPRLAGQSRYAGAPAGCQCRNPAERVFGALAGRQIPGVRSPPRARLWKIKPDYPEAWNNIAASYNSLSDWDNGIAACEQALRMNQITSWPGIIWPGRNHGRPRPPLAGSEPPRGRQVGAAFRPSALRGRAIQARSETGWKKLFWQPSRKAKADGITRRSIFVW